MTVGLAEVLPSAAAALGVPGFVDRLSLGPARHAVVVLVDGLGLQALLGHREFAPTLSALLRDDDPGLQASFPTTTPVGLASLGTGLLPGAHGFVGASFLLPETGHVLSPLQWGSDPTPVAVQPEPTVFERVVQAGRRAVSIGPAAYRESGLTRAVLRGAEYCASEDADSRADVLRRELSGSSTLAYVYWSALDRTGHEFGLDSEQWRSALGDVDRLVAGLQAELPSDSAMVVTADHGMVDCPDRVSIETTPGLADGLRHVAGEPRVRHLYVHAGAEASVLQAWREVLGPRAQVLTREELVASGRLGEVDPELAGRVGDIVAVCQGNWMLASHTDTRVSSLPGQHGGWTPDEILVPGLRHHS